MAILPTAAYPNGGDAQAQRAASWASLGLQLLRLQAEGNRRGEEMMASTAWPGTAFTGIGPQDHMDKVEETFITNAPKLGRVPRAGETEYVVLDVTKKTLFLQSCVQAVVNRLRRVDLVGAADMRMEVQV